MRRNAQMWCHDRKKTLFKRNWKIYFSARFSSESCLSSCLFQLDFSPIQVVMEINEEGSGLGQSFAFGVRVCYTRRHERSLLHEVGRGENSNDARCTLVCVWRHMATGATDTTQGLSPACFYEGSRDTTKACLAHISLWYRDSLAGLPWMLWEYFG